MAVRAAILVESRPQAPYSRRVGSDHPGFMKLFPAIGELRGLLFVEHGDGNGKGVGASLGRGETARGERGRIEDFGATTREPRRKQQAGSDQ